MRAMWSHQPAGAPGHRHDDPPGALQALQRGVGLGRQLALGGQRVVDVEEQAVDAARVAQLAQAASSPAERLRDALALRRRH